MLAASYSFQHSRFLAEDSLSALFDWERSGEYRNVANSPEHLASFRGALPILGRTLMLGSRLSVESGRYDRNERLREAPQTRTDAFVIWDVMLTGTSERHGLSWAAGVYNAFDWQYSLPVSAEFTQRTVLQDGRSLALSADVTF
jgi:outer membrane receptor protein involved in Fe transport